MKLVYIASPFAGDVEQNIENARRYCLKAMDRGSHRWPPI